MGDQACPEPTVSVQRDLRLLEAAGAHPAGAPAERLAREAELPSALAEEHLRALVQDGYLRKLDDGAFAVPDRGPAPDAVGGGGIWTQRLRPLLTSLRDGLSAAAYLTLYDEGEIRVVQIVDSPRAPRVDLWVGFEDAGHATALGKSVLGGLDEEARANYLSRHPLAGLTSHTITHREELMRELEAPPMAPLAMDREEYRRGTTCIAVRVYCGDQVGSLGISFRSDRMYRTSEVRAELLSSALRVTRRMTIPE
ncbi:MULTISPECIES: IclR family transcriptional regulator C-terminal domain-containing protein [Streptomyces]|uniref:IclR family transcriptional regulator n=1 Tax=Streptomyces TaxID=1883 RepID=UPI000D516CAC|nr:MULTISPECIES: IclR family transcriptional regulator C-terminal domain-containing protein [Streptomyces]PVC63155.1 transcriptional regulator [Streptomyces sp. CS065A]